ncbi:TetR/AcrR family transcriptional regulator [Nocardioides rubriscoriae]|uniref:TetR/AcrR family transcriptional regulator n=1 Tax=Nocardioides rubriscoriae TaxID=642762 RepID=UPI0011DF98D5|nr:TetR/AcrR family transcriptional regulator [Nocardioides rubriscoriae]
MARWEPDARGRLQQAALDLFAEQGFETTSVAQIAERAGVTERTYFRHHADKREVLFAGSEDLEELVVAGVRGAADGVSHLEALVGAFASAQDFFDERRAFVVARHQVLAASRELRERELAKLAALAAALAAALRARGATPVTASLLGDVGVAVFATAFESWVVDGGSLAAQVRDVARELAQAIHDDTSVGER